MHRPLALAALVLGAGCAAGGDGPTREEWAAEANAICRTFEERITGLGTPTTSEDARAFIERALPLAREEVRELRALEEPPDDEERIERMLAAVDEGIDALATIGEGADPAAATERAEAASQRANRTARELGADDCAADVSG